MKLLKILLLLVLIFGVLYFGATFYLAKNIGKLQPKTTPVEVEELRNLHEQLAVFEQKINDLQNQGKEYSDEEEAAEGLRQRIQMLKEAVAAKALEFGPDAAAKHFSLPSGAFFEDQYRLVFLGGIGVLICVIVLFLAIGSLRKKGPSRPVRPQSQAGGADLRATLEKFKAQQSGAPIPDTSMVDQKTPEKEALEEARERLRKKAELLGGLVGASSAKNERAPAQPEGGGAPDDLVDQVFALHGKGFDVEYISEKLRVNQDQVRLILRFKR